MEVAYTIQELMSTEGTIGVYKLQHIYYLHFFINAFQKSSDFFDEMHSKALWMLTLMHLHLASETSGRYSYASHPRSKFSQRRLEAYM